MIKVPFRVVLLSLVALVAVGGLVVSKSDSDVSQSTSKEGACKESGVTLVIDFGKSFETKDGSKKIIKCISNFNGTGWQLIKAAGIELVGTSEYPESFVCRIDGVPKSAIEDCAGTPGSNGGSWVYYYATTGTGADPNEWRKSPVGAATRRPKCGDVEGWLFQDTGANVSTSEDLTEKAPAPKPEPITCR